VQVTVLTILLWPQAASTQAVTSIREALTALEGLQAGVWENGAIASGWAQLAANTNFTLRVNDSYLDEFLPAGLVVHPQCHAPNPVLLLTVHIRCNVSLSPQ
jgi:hypothetical protein